MNYAQLIIDSPISSNWVIAALLAVALFMIKRVADKADIREKKIDDILEKQQKQLDNHELMLREHNIRLESHSEDIGERNQELANALLFKIDQLNKLFGKD